MDTKYGQTGANQYKLTQDGQTQTLWVYRHSLGDWDMYVTSSKAFISGEVQRMGIKWSDPDKQAQLIYNVAKSYWGGPHGHFVNNDGTRLETDIEFPNALRAVQFAEAAQRTLRAKAEFRDGIRTVDQTVVVTVSVPLELKP